MTSQNRSHRKEETEGKYTNKLSAKMWKCWWNIFYSVPAPRADADWPPGWWLDIVKRDGRNCGPYYSTKEIFIILESGEGRLREEKEDRRKGDLDNSFDCVVFGRMCRQFVTSHFFVQRTMNITAKEILPPRRSSIFPNIHSHSALQV